MATTADIYGYLFAACAAGGFVSYIAPDIKQMFKNQSAKGIAKQVIARHWLEQFTPDQVAVIKNYLDNGGFSPGVVAVIGDLNFIVLCDDIGDTLRQCPDLLRKAMLRPTTPPG